MGAGPALPRVAAMLLWLGYGSAWALGAAPLQGVTRLAPGSGHTCALTQGGGVKCWGINEVGQLGDGTTTQRLIATDVQGLSSGIGAIAAGDAYVCALTLSGGAKCWGANSAGQLGDNTTAEKLTAVDVQGLSSGVSAITTGDQHSCALSLGGGVKCWGRNSSGELGDGTTTDRRTPVAVQGLSSGVSAIAAGWYHTCALTLTGGVKCWGSNDSGQLGDNTTTRRLTAADVPGLTSGVTAIASGSDHTCALTQAGGVKCWGRNDAGQLGDNTTTTRLIPVDVPGLSSGVSAIAAGTEHTCALTSSGAVKCWGGNDHGQLGDNTTTRRLTAVVVQGLTSGVTAVKVGALHSCALTQATGVKCWGRNNEGQLGDGTTTDRLTPVDVLAQANDAARRVTTLTPAANDASLAPRSDASGRYSVFQSRASNLVTGDSNNRFDIFRVDSETGQTIRVSVNTDGSQSSGDAIEPSVTANGQLVAFVAPEAALTKLWGESKATAEARIKGGGFGIFLRNMLTGTTQRIGAALPSGQGTQPQLSPNGNAVVFTAVNTNPSVGAVGQTNAFILPLQHMGDAVVPGELTCVSCKSRSVLGAAVADADGESRNPVVSADGRYVAFETVAKNSLAGNAAPCPGASAAIVLRDMLTGTSQRVSPPAGLPQASCGAAGSTQPSLDYSGLNLAFQSDQPLRPGDANLLPDIYAYSISAPGYTRISQPGSGSDGNGESTQPVISGDGRTIAFVSKATNLDGSFAATNNKANLHAKRRDRDGDPERLSRSTTGAESDDDANRPALNYNGTLMVFDSAASNLAPGAGATNHVFQRVLPANGEQVFGTGFE